MPCFYPIDAFRAKTPNANGKYPIVFNREAAQQDAPLQVPCGKCIGCRLEHSRQWAMRCVHEASLHPANSFITLTYDDEHLPPDQSIHLSEWQNFMKKLRHKVDKKIRFYACGEYGENRDLYTISTLGRPHYHAIIFGEDFKSDRKILKKSKGEYLYTSETLEKAWPKGHHSIGQVNFDTAAYVARYQMKKINGDQAEDHYKRINSQTGEVTNVHPEFATMSRRPGIAADWFNKYRTDLDKGYITLKGRKLTPPKYYKYLYEKHHEEDYEKLKEKIRTSINPDDEDKTLNRLRVREESQIIKQKRINRQ